MSSGVVRRGGAALAGACLLLSGCAGAQDDSAAAAAEAFYAAVGARDGVAACEALATPTRDELEQSSDKPCAQAVLEEDVPEVGRPVGVEVFGTMAEVTYDGDRAFLSRYPGGWRVYAAACTPRGADRFDCLIAGG